jgi:delta-aminolevulinic acid dehydratase/porphobilinogen synthase
MLVCARSLGGDAIIKPSSEYLDAITNIDRHPAKVFHVSAELQASTESV